MGIFDIFKTKVSEAADKVGDVAEQARDKAGDFAGDVKDKVADLRDRNKDVAPETMPDVTRPADDAAPEAARMVSEGGPIAESGEAAPGLGDDGAPNAEREDPAERREGEGITGTIKENLSGGVDEAAARADSASGGKYGDQIQSGSDKAKDMLS